MTKITWDRGLQEHLSFSISCPQNVDTLQNWSHNYKLWNTVRVLPLVPKFWFMAKVLSASTLKIASEWCRISSNNRHNRRHKHFPYPSNKMLLAVFSGINISLLQAHNQKGVTSTLHYRVISQRSPGYTMGGNPALQWEVCWESLIKSLGRRNLGFGLMPAVCPGPTTHS